MTLIIEDSLQLPTKMTLSITIHFEKRRYAECRVFIVMLSVVMMNVIMLSVMAPFLAYSNLAPTN
jgi:hypothetical protein